MRLHILSRIVDSQKTGDFYGNPSLYCFLWLSIAKFWVPFLYAVSHGPPRLRVILKPSPPHLFSLLILSWQNEGSVFSTFTSSQICFHFVPNTEGEGSCFFESNVFLTILGKKTFILTGPWHPWLKGRIGFGLELALIECFELSK